MMQVSHEAFAAFIGIDWADAKHDICLQAAGTAKRECFQLEHTPEAIDVWVTTLRTRCTGQPVAICLELHKGPLVSAWRTDDFLALFPINPLTLAQYRKAFTPRRAKDGPHGCRPPARPAAHPSRQAAASPATEPHGARPRTAR